MKGCVIKGLLCGLDHLSQLALGGDICGADTLTEMLASNAKIGCNLKTLSFVNFSSCDVDPCQVLNTCPNLTFLHLGVCSVVFSEMSNCSSSSQIESLVMNVHALIGASLWQTLFLACSQLTSIDLTPCESMTDESMGRILQGGGGALKKLKSFVVRGRHCGGDVALTERTIQNLASACQHLETVGDCSTWARSASS